VKVDENTFISGCEDGYVRGIGVKPNKVLQVLGQHEEDDQFPIQHLSLSYCKNFLASTSHDNSIKFYDVSNFVKSRQGVKV
jgi:WD40 repeat protein